MAKQNIKSVFVNRVFISLPKGLVCQVDQISLMNILLLVKSLNVHIISPQIMASNNINIYIKVFIILLCAKFYKIVQKEVFVCQVSERVCVCV